MFRVMLLFLGSFYPDFSVVFSDYHDTLATEFFGKAGVSIDKIAMPDRTISYDIEKYTSARK